MNKIVVLLLMTMTLHQAQAGLLVYGICQTGCNAVWVACVAAAGGIAGATTGGAGVLDCNAAQGKCMAACVAAGLTPTP